MIARFEFIDAEKATRSEVGDWKYTIRQMCCWLEVSTSGYYDWVGRRPSASATRHAELGRLVRLAFEQSDGTYGHRRCHAQLARWDVHCSLELVRGLLREQGLVACQPRPFRTCLTLAGDIPAPLPDLVARDFTAAAPGRRLVGDITYIPTWQGWLFVATVIDCHTKEVIGHATGDNYQTPLISAAIRMAARHYQLEAGAIFHSDRGSNYTSAEYAAQLTALDLRQSVGRTGSCFDNALAESFFATLKNERTRRTEYATRDQARRDVIRYIELRYNRRRLHSALGYKTPHEVHAEYLQRSEQQAAA